MSEIFAAICEDNRPALLQLSGALQLAFHRLNAEIVLEEFYNGDELLESLQNGRHYTIYFMDIELPGKNGIEICHEIVNNDPSGLIIFISNKEELVFRSFEVRPFRFIRKSHFYDEIDSVVADILQELKKRLPSVITIREQHSQHIYSFDINQIKYIEVFLKYCTVHTVQGTVELKCPLSDFESQLNDIGFLKPHRSFLVNYRYIFNIGKDSLQLTDHTQLPLSRRKAEAVRLSYLHYMRKEQL